MNSWLVWGGFAAAVVFLGWIAYHFTVRTLRFVTLALAVAGAVLVTRYGVTHSATAAQAAPVDLVNAFTRGLDNLSGAFFQPLLPSPDALLPGHIGWLVIIAFLALAYRELEAWAMRWQPPAVDTSALDRRKPGTQKNSAPGRGGPDQRSDHDKLVAELRFRLPAVEVRAPAILPGGTAPNGLASIAENSGVDGSGLTGAIIRVTGMLWPTPRRYQVRVWVWDKPADPATAANPDAKKPVTVTVDLEDAQTGGSIATNTLAARDVDDAAARVAAYVARQVFKDDPTTPPWSVGSFDGSDLAALVCAKQQRELIDRPEDADHARCERIEQLEKAVTNSPGAGVARYELALLDDLQGHHLEALLLHAINREQYPRFFRGRYRLGMSLEMIANPEYPPLGKKAAQKLREILDILYRCHVTDACKPEISPGKLKAPLRKELLTAAAKELRECRRQLTLWRLIRAMLWHRDERAMRKPYWRLRERQCFQDGVRVAELLVAVRQSLNEQERGDATKGRRQKNKVRHNLKRAMRITATIAGDITSIKALLNQDVPDTPKDDERKWRTGTKARKTRWLPWQRRTPSWQAAYNAACLYAALAASSARGQQNRMARMALRCLNRVVNDRHCEMERPWDWISKDPDLRCLVKPRDLSNPEKFRNFLDRQKLKDYPNSNHGPIATVTGWPAIQPPRLEATTCHCAQSRS